MRILNRAGKSTTALLVAGILVLHLPLSLCAQNLRLSGVRSAPRPTLSGAAGVSSVLLPNFALRSAPVPAAAPSLSASLVAPAAAPAPSVARHPVVDIINRIQDAGAALPEGTATPADAANMLAAAEALPPGKARDGMIAMAQAVSYAPGSGAGAPSGEALDRAFENSAAYTGGPTAVEPQAPSLRAEGFWGSMSRMPLLPKSLKARFAAKAESRRPKAALRDLSSLEVPVEKLRWIPAPESLPASTKEVPPSDKQVVGQDRGVKAILFGLKIPGENYNLFISGPEGSGRETALRQILEQLAPTLPAAPDIVAATNFKDPTRPVILELPTGTAKEFAIRVKGFVKKLQVVLPRALNSGQIGDMKKSLISEYKEAEAARQKAFEAEVAQVSIGKFGIAVMTEETENGTAILVAPTYQGSSLKREQVDAKIAAGEFTAEEWEKAKTDGAQAAGPYVEKLKEMLHKNMEELSQVAETLGQMDAQGAKAVVGEIGAELKAMVSPQSAVSHDDAAHQELAARAQERERAFRDEVAGVRVGRFGLAIEARPGADGKVRMAAGLTVDGEPLTAEILQAKGVTKEEISAAQPELAAAAKPLFTRYMELMKATDAEHQAIHDANPPAAPTPAQAKAMAYVDRMLVHAAKEYQVFMPQRAPQGVPAAMAVKDPAQEYKVSILAANKPGSGAPVIWEKSPSYENLFGSVDDKGQIMMVPGMGMVKKETPGGPTLRGGSFVKANGGFLILNVMDVLREPGAFQGLMRAVRNGEAEISEGGPMSLMASNRDRHPVASKVKVVLIGSPMLRMLLSRHDEDFARGFNAQAAFESTFDITKETIAGYVAFMKKMVLVSAGQIIDFGRDAISAVLEHGARLAGSNEKLTAQFAELQRLMREATQAAKERGVEQVSRGDVDAALEARKERESGHERRLLEIYKKGVFHVDSKGAVVGQINGLAVMGDFGVPMRMTAVVSAGKPGVISVDRGAGTTGSSFNKALGVVEGFLRHTFAARKAFSANISLSAEQSYGGIDGDSATSTEIYAILSSMSGVPIQQRFAVTGSADQFGRVQAIGGANEKAEGFYKVSSQFVNKAFSDGVNAVIVPATNIGDLMLKAEVVQAVKEGKFKIYGVRTISEGIELLTGVPYSEILRKAAARLEQLSAGAKGE